MDVHAHLLIASSIDNSLLSDNLKKESADTSHFIHTQMGIDGARKLTEASLSRGWEGRRNFVVFTEGITHEAQNALLKLFEEPPVGAVFYLILPNSSTLLPTLRSRLIQTTKDVDQEDSELLNEFMEMPLGNKLESIATLSKKNPEKLKSLILSVSKMAKNPKAKKSTLLALKYINNRGASKKMLAEELAIALSD